MREKVKDCQQLQPIQVLSIPVVSAVKLGVRFVPAIAFALPDWAMAGGLVELTLARFAGRLSPQFCRTDVRLRRARRLWPVRAGVISPASSAESWCSNGGTRPQALPIVRADALKPPFSASSFLLPFRTD